MPEIRNLEKVNPKNPTTSFKSLPYLALMAWSLSPGRNSLQGGDRLGPLQLCRCQSKWGGGSTQEAVTAAPLVAQTAPFCFVFQLIKVFMYKAIYQATEAIEAMFCFVDMNRVCLRRSSSSVPGAWRAGRHHRFRSDGTSHVTWHVVRYYHS